MVSIFLPLLLFAFYRTHYSAKISGLLAGMGVGSALENRYIRFVEKAHLKRQFLKVLVGLFVLFLIRSGMEKIFPEVNLCELVGYVVMGLWVFFFAPMVWK